MLDTLGCLPAALLLFTSHASLWQLVSHLPGYNQCEDVPIHATLLSSLAEWVQSLHTLHAKQESERQAMWWSGAVMLPER